MDVDVVEASQLELSPPTGAILGEGGQEEDVDVSMTMGGNDLTVPSVNSGGDDLLPDVNLAMSGAEAEEWDAQMGLEELALIDAFEQEYDSFVEPSLHSSILLDTDMPDLPHELPNQLAPAPIEVSSETALLAFESDPGLLGEDDSHDEEEEEKDGEGDDLDGDSDIFQDPDVLPEKEEKVTTDKQPVAAAVGEEFELPIDPRLFESEASSHAPPAVPEEQTPEPESALFGSGPAEVAAPEETEDLSLVAAEPAAVPEQQAPASPPAQRQEAAPAPAPAARAPEAVLFGGFWIPGGNAVQQSAKSQGGETPQQPAAEARAHEAEQAAAVLPPRQQGGTGSQELGPSPATPSRGMAPRRKPKKPSLFITPRRPAPGASVSATRSGGASADRDRAARHSVDTNLERSEMGLPAEAGSSPAGPRLLALRDVLLDQGMHAKAEAERKAEKEEAKRRAAEARARGGDGDNMA